MPQRAVEHRARHVELNDRQVVQRPHAHGVQHAQPDDTAHQHPRPVARIAPRGGCVVFQERGQQNGAINHCAMRATGHPHHQPTTRGMAHHHLLLPRAGLIGDQVDQIILVLANVIHIPPPPRCRAMPAQIGHHHVRLGRQRRGQRVKLHAMPARSVNHDHQGYVAPRRPVEPDLQRISVAHLHRRGGGHILQPPRQRFGEIKAAVVA